MAEAAVFEVRVTPRARRDEIAGWQESVLAVRLRALPVDGAANLALRRLIADRLAVAPGRVEIVAGAASRLKRLRVEGLSAAEVRARLA